jgi:hypothetical protein
MRTICQKVSQSIKVFSFGTFIVIALVIVSCSLDQPEVPEGLLQKTVFESKDLADQVLATAYLQIAGFNLGGDWDMPSCGVYGGGSQGQSHSDEAFAMLRGSWEFMHEFYYKGGLQPTNAWAGDKYPAKMEDKYMLHYQAIRSCYDYLENCGNIKDATPEYIQQRRGEALVVLAYHYYEMLKRYGGVPWVNKVYRSGEVDDLARLKIKDLADSICGVLDRAIAIPEFEARHTTENYGLTNKMAAMMLKARVRLVSASPLFNSDIYPVFLGDKAVLRHDDYDNPTAVQARWQLAATAAREAIEFAHQNGYALYDNPADQEGRQSGKYFYWATTIETNEEDGLGKYPWNGNTEVIWVFCPSPIIPNKDAYLVIKDPTNTFPGGGFNANLPLQNLVDLFELKDGRMQWEVPDFYTGAVPKYDELDARFHHTVVVQGEEINVFGKTLIVNFIDDNNPTCYSAMGYTGYARRKNFSDLHIVPASGVSFENTFHLMRLAELYLVYAEALNESDPGNPDILLYLNKVRERSGQPKLENCGRFQNTQEYVRACIKNERMVELSFE